VKPGPLLTEVFLVVRARCVRISAWRPDHFDRAGSCKVWCRGFSLLSNR